MECKDIRLLKVYQKIKEKKNDIFLKISVRKGRHR